MIFGNIDTSRRPFLIAEIGNNHEGDGALAHQLADAALDAGAHAVKFQIIDPPRLVNRSQEQRIAQLSRFQLPLATFVDIAEKVRSRGGLFMVSAFDTDSLMAIAPYLDAVKIASGDLDFDAMLEVAASLGKPMVLSTGMSTMDEIARSIGVIEAALPSGVEVVDRLAVLHCVSLYPTPLEAANLGAIPRMAAELGVTVGYSDHTLGIEAAVAALALGARVIEKHFTLAKTHSSFRDHALSADPAEFATLARVVRAFDKMRGSGERDTVQADLATRGIARRSVVAARDLPKGTVLQQGDLDYVRPAGGVPPTEARQLIGRRLNTTLAIHQLIRWADVE